MSHMNIIIAMMTMLMLGAPILQVLTGLNEGDVIIAGPGRVFHQLKAGMAVSTSTPASSAQDKPMESDDAKH